MKKIKLDILFKDKKIYFKIDDCEIEITTEIKFENIYKELVERLPCTFISAKTDLEIKKLSDKEKFMYKKLVTDLIESLNSIK